MFVARFLVTTEWRRPWMLIGSCYRKLKVVLYYLAEMCVCEHNICT